MNTSRAFLSHLDRIEKTYDVDILPSDAYIVILSTEPCQKLREYSKMITDRDFPVVIYVYLSQIIIVFFGGIVESRRKQGIFSVLSKYVSELTLYTNFKVMGKVLIMENRTSIFAYIQKTMIDNSKETIFRLLDRTISIEEINRLTFSEIMIKLKDKEIDWNSISCIDRVGMFIKKNRDIELMLRFDDIDRQMIILFSE